MPGADASHPRAESLWLEQALAAEAGDEAAPELEGSVDTDVCIVGGGYLGLWTALRLRRLDPGVRVTVVEAGVCGSGASGRNGGMALSWWPKIETLIERVGREEAFRLAHESARAIAEIGELCQSEGVNADFVQGGWLWTATSEAQLGAWRGAVALARSGGAEPLVELDREELKERTGSPAHLAGVLDPVAATVHPGLLARGLRRVALREGVEIFERSPVVALDRGSGAVRCAHGEVRPRTTILASNAWAAQVRALRRAIVPLSSDVVATEPIPGALERSGWTGGESISNSRLMVDYYRTTRDGRIVFGRGGGAVGWRGRFGAEFEHSTARTEEIQRVLARLVPAAAGARVTHAWAGAVDRTTDGLPIFGVLSGRARVLFGVGFSGNGVAQTLTGAKILASLGLEIDDEWSGSGLARGVNGRFPPEPVRHVGGRLVRAAVRRKEVREDEGRGVDRLTRRVAAFAPSGFFKVSQREDSTAEH